MASPAEAEGGGGRRGDGLWLPGLILSGAAILLRLAVASRREGIEVDGITYLTNARALLSDFGAFTVLHPPLYSILLTPFLWLSADAEWVARVVSAVLGGLWVWPTLWLSRGATDARVAWLAGLLVAVSPSAVEASTRVLSEPIAGLTLTTFFVVLVRALRTGSLGSAALAGVLGGLTTLSRPEGMAYLALAWVVLARAPRLVAWRASRHVLAGLGVLTLVWCAVLFPYMALVKRETGHWHWSGKVGQTLVFAESVGDERPGAAMERAITDPAPDVPRTLLDYVLARPREAVKRIAINLHLVDKYFAPGLLQSGGIALLAVGLVQLQWRRGPAPPEWFLAIAPLPLLGLLLFVLDARYGTPLVPVLSIIAAIGLRRLGQPDDPSPHLSVRARILLVVVLLSFGPWIARPWFRQDPAAVEKQAGLWIRRSTGPGATFIGRYPVIAHYAEARAIPFGQRSLDAALAEGRSLGARFVVADSVRLPESRPDLLGLVAGARVSPDLELTHVEEDRAGRRVVIYQIRDADARRVRTP